MRVGLAAACAATLVAAVAAPAAAERTTADVVGGSLLARPGVVVQPLAGTPALPRRLSASAWLVADADTGDVLAAKDAHVRHLPASTMKVLTALTLLPTLEPGQQVRTSWHDAAVDGTKVGLVPGMRYSVDTLFQSMLIVSANDAADALADAAGGTAHTVSMMNAEARHLQAYDTVARTPSGLDRPGESTSAYDLALIMRAALRLPEFRHYVGITMSHVPAPHHKRYQIYTHNQLLPTYRGMIGGKNGYTVAARATYVAAARRHGHTIIVTMLHANPNFWADARALLDWGFKAEGRVIPVGTLVGPAVPHLSDQPSTSHTATVELSARHHGDTVSPWELAALAASAAIAVAVSARRLQRRAGRRLSLPPL